MQSRVLAVLTFSLQEGEEGEGADVEAEADLHFEPIVKLEAVEVKTMEEDEDVMFESRAKLYRFDDEEKAWKERGLGDAKLLKHKQTGKVRFLMRREKTLKICANHYLDGGMELKASNMAENVWTWYTPADFADEEPKPEKFAIRFKLEETFHKFKEVFEEGCKENARIAASGPPRPTLAEVAKPLTVKKTEGSWKCDTCLVSNPPGSTACAACQTPKPGEAPAAGELV